MLKNTLYEGNAEYRAELRNFFNMDTSSIRKELESLDVEEETIDEMVFDNEATKELLEKIYSLTRSNKSFITMYTKAAARMFSEDPEIGLVILLTYDHFWLFKQVYEEYLKLPEQDRSKWEGSLLFNNLYNNI